MTDYRLIRSNRRTLSLSIDGEGALVVHAPMRMPQTEIEAFIREKERWIAQKQALVKERVQAAQQARLEAGARIPFRGGSLEVRFADIPKAYDENGFLYVPVKGEVNRHALAWRMQKARELLVPRVEMWAERSGIRPEKISFGNAAARWGSMNSRREMRLNAALVHVPEEMADYVIVHELSHIVHANHSPAFHALVRRILPDADGIRQRMKAYTYVIRLWK